LKRLKCYCGSESFEVSRDAKHIRCVNCRVHYRWNQESWKKVEPKKRLLAAARHIIQKPIERTFETLGALRKRLGYRKILKRELEEKKKEPLRAILKVDKISSLEIEHLKRKWKSEIKALESGKGLIIGCNEHKNRLRGRHIAEAMKRDLKRFGIKSKVSPCGKRGAIIKVVE